jgi:hypothetical protein
MTPKQPKMRPLGCGAFADAPDCHRPSLPQGAARALLRVIDRVPEAVLALSAS